MESHKRPIKSRDIETKLVHGRFFKTTSFKVQSNSEIKCIPFCDKDLFFSPFFSINRLKQTLNRQIISIKILGNSDF